MDRSELLRNTLARPEIHEAWLGMFLTPDREALSEAMFDHIAARFGVPTAGVVLDAGCGNAQNAVRLAKRGFTVHGVDFAENRVEAAREYAQKAGCEGRVRLSREDLTALSLPDRSFRHVLCWGVLMHIHDMDAALSELVRVLKPGGLLVIGENNMRSLDTWLIRLVRRLRGSGPARDELTPAGREQWIRTRNGPLLIRTADIGWCVRRLKALGLTLRERRASELTEMYARVRSPSLRRALHRINRFWFRYVGVPYLAFGNLLVFEK